MSHGSATSGDCEILLASLLWGVTARQAGGNPPQGDPGLPSRTAETDAGIAIIAASHAIVPQDVGKVVIASTIAVCDRQRRGKGQNIDLTQQVDIKKLFNDSGLVGRAGSATQELGQPFQKPPRFRGLWLPFYCPVGRRRFPNNFLLWPCPMVYSLGVFSISRPPNLEAAIPKT